MNFLNYEEMVQNALINVVKETLSHVGRNGLPGDHHFYISFRTDHPQTVIPDYLKEKYPEEITIVLQYQFWDLKISSEEFSITLSFNEELEHLTVPFSALTSFVDPAVRFGLQFTPQMPASSSMPIASPLREEKSPASSNNVIALDSFRKK